MEQSRRKRYGRALGVFLIVILACTVISRVADSMTIPKVTVEKAGSGRITCHIKGNGSVETMEKSTCLVPEGCLVETCLDSGTSVKEGDVLIQFQMEYLEKRKAELEQAQREALLALEQARLNQQEDAWVPAAEEAGQSLKVAQAEWDQAVAARNQAQAELEQAQAELEEAEAGGENQAQGAGNAWESQAQAEPEEAEAGGENRAQGAGNVSESQKQTEAGADNTLESQDQGNTEQHPEDLEAARQRLAEAQQTLEGARQQADGAQQALSQAQQAYRSAEKSDEAARQNSAKARKSADLSVESAQLSLNEAEQRVMAVQELLDQGGRICASEAGIFLNTSVTAGTVTSGSEFISIGTGGLLFTAELSTSVREKLVLGDEILVKLPGREECRAAITELVTQKRSEDGQEVLLVKALLPTEGEPAVGQASFSLEKKSDQMYGTVLPLTAIRQDNKGYYCLGIRTQSSILGQEQRAEEIRLTVLDQDDTKAAVEGAILEDTRIIVSSEKQVNAEDRVKVEG